MQMALGQFTFEIGSAAYLELSRSTEWRHAKSDRVGARPASQFVGPGADTVSLAGIVLPGVSGRHSALRTLRTMGDEGERHPLVDARGTVHGIFTIARLDETQSQFIDTGEPRKADFTLELERVQ